MFKLLLTGLFFCSTALSVKAQLKLVAVPDKIIIHPHETLQLQFVAEGISRADEFTAPVFRNFERIGNVIESNGWTWVNGSLTEYVSYTYLLRPKVKGKLAIASAVMKVKGKMYASQPVTIQVTDAVTVNGSATANVREEKPDYYLLPNEDAKEKIKKNLFVRAEVDKQSCYEGEALLATFKLYTRLDSESKIVKRPSFNGFSVIDLEEPEAGLFTKEMVNGKLYNCYLIRKVQLFPLQNGEVVIEPVEIVNSVRLIRAPVKDGREWMDALSNEEQKNVLEKNLFREELTLTTPAIKINVKELPDKKPESFNGAIGSFSMRTTILKNAFSANENGVLQIEVKGSGNIHLLNAPSINWSAGIQAYEPKVKEELNKLTTPLSGVKIFEIPFSAAKGVYQLPPVVFSFFDAVSKTYRTVTGDSLHFSVTEAAGKKRTNLYSPQEKIEVSNNNTWYLWCAGIAAILALLAFFAFRQRRTSKVAVQPQPETEPTPLQPAMDFISAAAASKNSVHMRQFYSLLPDGLIEFFIDRLELHQTKISTAAITDLLRQKAMYKEADQWVSIVNRCEEAVFSPIELDISKDELLQDAALLMEHVDEKLYR
mgnify:CR=1 FL=1